MSPYVRFIPWGAVAIVVAYLGYVMSPAEEPAQAMQLSEFGKLPVQERGRQKPWDTEARVNLMIISGRQTFYDKDGNEHPAIEWLLDVVSTSFARKSQLSDKVRAFRIDDAELRQALRLQDRSPPLYSYEELGPNFLSELVTLLKQRHPNGPEKDGPGESDTQLVEVATQLQAYERFAPFETPYRVFRVENDQLLALLGLEPRPGLRYSYDEFVPRMAQLIREADRIRKIDSKEHTAFEAKTIEFYKHVQQYVGLALLELDTLRVVPPADSNQEEWRTYDQVHAETRGGEGSPMARSFQRILASYAKGDVQGFNKAVADYGQLVKKSVPRDTRKSRFEAYFNHVAPFSQCMYLYVAVFLFACASWIGYSKPLGRTALLICALTFLFHFAGILARIVIQGRPPVTNLYSSAVFVGCACVALGLFLELIYPYSIASAAAAVLGFLTAFLAHHLAGSGDTMEMMQAVLDTNFWLATHVTAVTIGYAATLLAGVVGILYVLFGLIAAPGNSSVLKIVSIMIYGIVCFATLFSFTGTVLGGIWADQSWGRFWGWDPKENGALIIVIWNALILHARWAGLVKHRGLAVLSIVGIMVTIWSWIGTNQLGVGLHNYGFNSTLARIAVITWGGSLSFVLVGALTPLRYWRALQRSSQE